MGEQCLECLNQVIFSRCKIAKSCYDKSWDLINALWMYFSCENVVVLDLKLLVS